MKILEFGNPKKEKIILIHGLECPYQIWNEYIEYYKKTYHIIVPILPGHYPSQQEEFVSFKQIIKEIEDYYIPKYGKNVYCTFGMSMGANIALKLYESKKFKIKKVIMESLTIIPNNKILNYILTKQYLFITHQNQKRNQLIINKITLSLVPKNKLNYFLKVIDNMSDKNIINYLKEISNYKIQKDKKHTNTELYYICGTKFNELSSKIAAKQIKKKYPTVNIVQFKRKGHCENTLIHPKKMIKELNKILSN